MRTLTDLYLVLLSSFLPWDFPVLFDSESRFISRYNGLVNTKAVGVTAATDNKGFVVTTKRAKLSHKPAKATIAVTMKAGLGRSLHKVCCEQGEYLPELKPSLPDKGQPEQAEVQEGLDQGRHEEGSCHCQV